jgi:hypothetical protein
LVYLGTESETDLAQIKTEPRAEAESAMTAPTHPVEDITRYGILALMAITITYDLIAGTGWGSEVTVSRVLYRFSVDHPIIAFGLGIIAGHIFWPLER